MAVNTSPLRILAALALLSLAACNSARDLDEATVPLGDFYFGHNIVVAENAQRGPLSREATAEEWEEALRTEMERRFRRFDGDRLYHLAIGVEGYILAVPGVPLVAAPKSALIFSVSVWDDAAGGRINEPHRLTVIESVSGGALLSSGLFMSREEQIQDLAQNAARSVERWMRNNMDWFGGVPEDPAGDDPQPTPPTAATQAVRDMAAAGMR